MKTGELLAAKMGLTLERLVTEMTFSNLIEEWYSGAAGLYGRQITDPQPA